MIWSNFMKYRAANRKIVFSYMNREPESYQKQMYITGWKLSVSLYLFLVKCMPLDVFASKIYLTQV